MLSGCSSDQKVGGPPKTGTLAHSWYMAGKAYESGDYPRAMQQLSELAAKNSEYRDRARYWLIVVAGGVADGYVELSNAYDAGSRLNRVVSAEYRKQMHDVRNVANAAALQFAEAVHDILDKNKDPKFAFDFAFPKGSMAEPTPMTRLNKGFAVQPADHQALRQSMAQRGVVKFAAALAGAPGDQARAAAQFANPPRDAVLTAIAQNLIAAANLYDHGKLDMPKRGNALCRTAMEALALVPDSKERKQLESKAKEELKKFKVEA